MEWKPIESAQLIGVDYKMAVIIQDVIESGKPYYMQSGDGEPFAATLLSAERIDAETLELEYARLSPTPPETNDG